MSQPNSRASQAAGALPEPVFVQSYSRAGPRIGRHDGVAGKHRAALGRSRFDDTLARHRGTRALAPHRTRAVSRVRRMSFIRDDVTLRALLERPRRALHVGDHRPPERGAGHRQDASRQRRGQRDGGGRAAGRRDAPVGAALPRRRHPGAGARSRARRHHRSRRSIQRLGILARGAPVGRDPDPIPGRDPPDAPRPAAAGRRSRPPGAGRMGRRCARRCPARTAKNCSISRCGSPDSKASASMATPAANASSKSGWLTSRNRRLSSARVAAAARVEFTRKAESCHICSGGVVKSPPSPTARFARHAPLPAGNGLGAPSPPARDNMQRQRIPPQA